MSRMFSKRSKRLAMLPTRDDRGQDTLEYLVVIGGLVVAMVIGLLGFDVVIQGLLGHLCPSVDTANPLVAVGSCITSIGG